MLDVALSLNAAAQVELTDLEEALHEPGHDVGGETSRVAGDGQSLDKSGVLRQGRHNHVPQAGVVEAAVGHVEGLDGA